MLWRQLSLKFAARDAGVVESPMPLTLVTLRIAAEADEVAIAFYADAEAEALMAWATRGRFILAFAALEREELTLVCPETPEALIGDINALPLVAAGLAIADLRPVRPVRMTQPMAHSLHFH